jgi:hypothetical protein
LGVSHTIGNYIYQLHISTTYLHLIIIYIYQQRRLLKCFWTKCNLNFKSERSPYSPHAYSSWEGIIRGPSSWRWVCDMSGVWEFVCVTITDLKFGNLNNSGHSRIHKNARQDFIMQSWNGQTSDAQKRNLNRSALELIKIFYKPSLEQKYYISEKKRWIYVRRKTHQPIIKEEAVRFAYASLFLLEASARLNWSVT